MNKKTVKKTVVPYGSLFIFMLLILLFMNFASNSAVEITYDKFVNEIKEENVQEVTIIPRKTAGIYEIAGVLKDAKENETFYLKAPLSEEVISQIINSNIEINTSQHDGAAGFT